MKKPPNESKPRRFEIDQIHQQTFGKDVGENMKYQSKQVSMSHLNKPCDYICCRKSTTNSEGIFFVRNTKACLLKSKLESRVGDLTDLNWFRQGSDSFQSILRGEFQVPCIIWPDWHRQQERDQPNKLQQSLLVCEVNVGKFHLQHIQSHW